MAEAKPVNNQTQSRAWCFTLNNFTEKDKIFFKDLEVKYIIFGEEVGSSGTPHLQGFIIFLRAYKFCSVKKLHKDCHWEPAKCEDAGNYCLKDQNYYKQDNRKQGHRSDLDSVVSNLKTGGLKKVLEENPKEYIKYHSGIEKLSLHYQKDRDFKPEVVWLYGATGTGKTRYVVEKEPELWMSGKNLKWWCHYENEEAVLFDDFRGDFCTFHELLRILDRYKYNIEVKGGYRKFNSKRIYITSCYPPEQIYETREDIGQLLRRIDRVIEVKSGDIFIERKKDTEDTEVLEGNTELQALDLNKMGINGSGKYIYNENGLAEKKFYKINE